MPEDFKNSFLKTLWILREYLNVVIVGGGWVPLVYYHYLLGDKSKTPIRTRDIDLVIDKKISIQGEKTIDGLLIESGMQVVFKSFTNPPAILYEGTIDGDDVEIEFITDLRGAREDIVIEVQKGLHAQALRFVSIILENTIEVTIDDFQIENKSQDLVIKVPSPEAYIFHKGLIFNRRKGKEKHAKDLYYIFDILANCPELEDRIFNGLRRMKKEYSSWFKRFEQNLNENFQDISSSGVMSVSSQRPSTAFPELTTDQLRQYVFGTFQNLISNIEQ